MKTNFIKGFGKTYGFIQALIFGIVVFLVGFIGFNDGAYRVTSLSNSSILGLYYGIVSFGLLGCLTGLFSKQLDSKDFIRISLLIDSIIMIAFSFLKKDLNLTDFKEILNYVLCGLFFLISLIRLFVVREIKEEAVGPKAYMSSFVNKYNLLFVLLIGVTITCLIGFTKDIFTNEYVLKIKNYYIGGLFAFAFITLIVGNKEKDSGINFIDVILLVSFVVAFLSLIFFAQEMYKSYLTRHFLVSIVVLFITLIIRSITYSNIDNTLSKRKSKKYYAALFKKYNFTLPLLIAILSTLFFLPIFNGEYFTRLVNKFDVKFLDDYSNLYAIVGIALPVILILLVCILRKIKSDKIVKSDFIIAIMTFVSFFALPSIVFAIKNIGINDLFKGDNLFGGIAIGILALLIVITFILALIRFISLDSKMVFEGEDEEVSEEEINDDINEVIEEKEEKEEVKKEKSISDEYAEPEFVIDEEAIEKILKGDNYSKEEVNEVNDDLVSDNVFDNSDYVKLNDELEKANERIKQLEDELNNVAGVKDLSNELSEAQRRIEELEEKMSIREDKQLLDNELVEANARVKELEEKVAYLMAYIENLNVKEDNKEDNIAEEKNEESSDKNILEEDLEEAIEDFEDDEDEDEEDIDNDLDDSTHVTTHNVEFNEVEVLDENGKPKILKKKFATRMMLAPTETKEYYSEVKNYLISYRAKPRSSSRLESFRYKGLIAKVALAGKAVKVYLALDPQQFEESKYHQKDMSEKKQFKEVPFMIKVKSDRGLKYFKELVDQMMANRGVKPKRNHENVDYVDGLTPNGECILSMLGLPQEYLMDSISEDTIPNDLPKDLEKYLPVVKENKLDGEKEEANVYLDTLCNHFNEGDVIKIDVLKSKHIVKAGNVLRIKARGTLNKKLTIYAEEFDSDALKMLICTNSTVVKVKH